MRKIPIEPGTGEAKPNMTSMIDVVFLLLVFFLATMQFRSLDMKIEAQLPHGKGVRPSIERPPEIPQLEARLARSGGVTRVRLQERILGAVGDPVTWERFQTAARAVRERHVAVGGDPADIEAKIDAAPGVPTGQVIRTIDAFHSADLVNVQFEGTPMRALDPLVRGVR